MKTSLTFIFLLFTASIVFAQKTPQYPVSEIPEELKKNADAVIRDYKVVKKIISINNVVTEEVFVVTIFNKDAQYLGYFREYYDKLSSIKYYSLKKYSAEGKLLDHPKLNEYKDQAAYQDFTLYDDQRVIYYNAMSSNYPYTIEIKFTKIRKESLFLGNWIPVPNNNISVQKSSFEVISNSASDFRYLELNMPDSCSHIVDGSKYHLKFELNNYKAIDWEPFMPDYTKIFPMVWLAPNDFSYDGSLGSFSSWENFGGWIWDLIKDRNTLNENTELLVQDLITNCKTDYEKTEVLYNYLQENTRYVNVSLGIGGFQPFDAVSVDETKYGDCKALSNYMLTLLKYAGVKSNYFVVKSGENKKIVGDFPSQQFNHAMLCVPNKGDTIWLECTNQKIPFGYIGESNHNKEVLLISEESGKIVRTPKYNKKINTQNRKINCKLDSLGNINFISNTNFQAIQYENVNHFFYMNREEQKKRLYKAINIPRTKINSFDISREKEAIPKATCNLDITIDQYASITGSRMLFSPNILNRHTYIPKKLKERKHPIKLSFEFEDTDTVTIELPLGYKIEYLPESTSIDTKFGSYESSYLLNGNKLLYSRSYGRKSGEFPKEDYNDLRTFLKRITKADKNKVVLIKE